MAAQATTIQFGADVTPIMTATTHTAIAQATRSKVLRCSEAMNPV